VPVLPAARLRRGLAVDGRSFAIGVVVTTVLWCGSLAFVSWSSTAKVDASVANGAGFASADIDWAIVLRETPDPVAVPDPIFRTRLAATGLPWLVQDKTSGVQLVLIPPGKYIRGAIPMDSVGQFEERPQHEVTITRPFYLGRHEVTNFEYRRHKRGHHSGDFKGLTLNGPEQPVVLVSWTEASEFCRANGLRLPTDGEWEYAARAGVTDRFLWGRDPGGGKGFLNGTDQKTQAKFEWYPDSFPFDDGFLVSSHAGYFRANGFGLHDVQGNAWEWCSDWFNEREFQQYQDRPAIDPRGPDSGSERTCRGGSWGNGPRGLRLSTRRGCPPGLRDVLVGFRVARSVR
jgi:sulfatase modifying factor 1